VNRTPQGPGAEGKEAEVPWVVEAIVDAEGVTAPFETALIPAAPFVQLAGRGRAGSDRPWGSISPLGR